MNSISDTLSQGLLELAHDTSVGQKCCENIVTRLGRLLGMRHVFVGVIDPDRAAHVQTLAVAEDGILTANIGYDLLGTPCANVVGQSLCIYPDNVCQTFPRDLLLQEMHVSSYLGAPIFDTEGRGVGLLVLLDDQPLEDSPPLRSLVQMHAVRAGVEIARMRYEQKQHDLSVSLEAEVARRTAELEQANRQLESFAFSISHDFRAPLRHVMGYCQLMTELDAVGRDPDARKYADTIMKACQKMAGMMDSLLSYSRNRSAQPTCDWVDLEEMLRDIVTQLREGVPGTLELKMAVRGVIWADPELIRVVLFNLVGNAIKYSSKQTHPLVSVSSVSSPEYDEILVEDNGVGFDMKYSGKLFGVFQRLHTEREFPGHGIGLATSMGIVRAHGGQIRYNSSPGSGAQFTVVLPRPS